MRASVEIKITGIDGYTTKTLVEASYAQELPDDFDKASFSLEEMAERVGMDARRRLAALRKEAAAKAAAESTEDVPF